MSCLYSFGVFHCEQYGICVVHTYACTTLHINSYLIIYTILCSCIFIFYGMFFIPEYICSLPPYVVAFPQWCILTESNCVVLFQRNEERNYQIYCFLLKDDHYSRSSFVLILTTDDRNSNIAIVIWSTNRSRVNRTAVSTPLL